jgi:putative endonuclease
VTRRTKTLGDIGERAAEDHVRRLGWRVLDRRWRRRAGELDLVAADGETVVFIEVKARSSARFGLPEEAVGRAKQARLSRLAGLYLRERGLAGRPARFDVIALSGGELRHIRGAFLAGGFCP